MLLPLLLLLLLQLLFLQCAGTECLEPKDYVNY